MGSDNFTYSDLVSSYGQDSAAYILKIFERMAEIENKTQLGDRETRLKYALEILNDTQTSTKH